MMASAASGVISWPLISPPAIAQIPRLASQAKNRLAVFVPSLTVTTICPSADCVSAGGDICEVERRSRNSPNEAPKAAYPPSIT
jgi:hypothetical protein